MHMHLHSFISTLTQSFSLRHTHAHTHKLTESVFMSRFNSDGHLINMTLPTGEVSSFHGNMEKAVRVEATASNRENFIIITNHSADNTIYTLRQGERVYVCKSID